MREAGLPVTVVVHVGSATYTVGRTVANPSTYPYEVAELFRGIAIEIESAGRIPGEEGNNG